MNPTVRRIPRRVQLYAVGVVLLVNLAMLAYWVGMNWLEDRPRSLLDALFFVVETFTTTGYGEDAPWEHPGMKIIVMAIEVTGVAIIFLTLPVFLIPVVEAALRTRPPNAAPQLRDHVVIAGVSERTRILLEELAERDQPHVVVIGREPVARELWRAGGSVVYGEPTSIDQLRRVGVEHARVLVADTHDEDCASVLLAARSLNPDLALVAMADDPAHVELFKLAGAHTVFTPRHMLGEHLGRKLQASFSTASVPGTVLTDDFEVAQLPVPAECPLTGARLETSGLRAESGVNVVGVWYRGRFSHPGPDTVLAAHSVLTVAGTSAEVDAARDLLQSSKRVHRTGEVFILGAGEVGRSVHAALEAAQIPHTLVDRDPTQLPDLVGDVAHGPFLESLDLPAAASVVLTLPNDARTLFSVLLIRSIAPDIEILARIHDADEIEKMYLAGADYVLAVSVVSARQLADAILPEEVFDIAGQLELVRTEARGLDGKTLGEADIRRSCGCTVLAVEREQETITSLNPDFRFQRGDTLVMVGPDGAIAQFEARYN